MHICVQTLNSTSKHSVTTNSVLLQAIFITNWDPKTITNWDPKTYDPRFDLFVHYRDHVCVCTRYVNCKKLAVSVDTNEKTKMAV